jgi:hypothetical protein
VEKYGTARKVTGDSITRRVRFEYWITNATDTLSQYVIFAAFSRKQRFYERALILRVYVLSIASFVLCKLN